MKVIVVLDNNNGLMFNNRRQSQDKVLRKHIRQLSKGSKLWMNAYSFQQFRDDPSNICVDEEFLNIAGVNDYCFVEDSKFISKLEKIGGIYIYRWNRTYPADEKLNVDFLEHGWILNCEKDFAGNSHEKITMEEWIYE